VTLPVADKLATEPKTNTDDSYAIPLGINVAIPSGHVTEHLIMPTIPLGVSGFHSPEPSSAVPMMWQCTILTTVVQCTLWLRQALRASAHEFSVPVEGAVSAVDGVTSRFVLSRALKALTVKAVWEARSLTAGALLGLLVVFVVYYLRSPWRKLPPRPRGLPIIGNALQAMDKSWLVSKDCKERFGEYQLLY